MSALDDLRTARYRRMESDYYSERLARLKSAAEGLNSQLGSGGGGSGKAHDKMAQLASTIVDLEMSIAQTMIDSEYRTIQAEKSLEQLPDEHRMVMRLRYISAMRWEEVAAVMGYSVRQCHRIFDSAMERISKPERCHTMSH